MSAVKSSFRTNTSFSGHDFQGQNGVNYTFSSKICQETRHISLQQQATARVSSKWNACYIKLEICSLVTKTQLFTKQWHLLCGWAFFFLFFFFAKTHFIAFLNNEKVTKNIIHIHVHMHLRTYTYMYAYYTYIHIIQTFIIA